MGQQGNADLTQMFAAIQAQLQTLGEHITWIKQPPPVRREPIRGANVQRVNQVEEDEHNLEDDPPPDLDPNHRPRK